MLALDLVHHFGQSVLDIFQGHLAVDCHVHKCSHFACRVNMPGQSRDPEFLAMMHRRFADELPAMVYDVRLRSEDASPPSLAAREHAAMRDGAMRERGMPTIERRNDPAALDRILRALPSWFGVEEAIRAYVQAAADIPSYLATQDRHVIGVALLQRHTPHSAELYLIAVSPDARGRGVGSSLVEAIETDLRHEGVRLLEVKTVGPSHQDEGYAATRAFYEARGFVPLQELDNIDWAGPTLILVKPLE